MLSKICLANPSYLDVNLDFQKTVRIFVVFLSLEPLASEIKILSYELKFWKISLRNHTSFLIVLISHKKTNYEKTY